MMQSFPLNCVPDLRVNWAPGSGMENVLIGDHNIKNCAAAAESKGKCGQVICRAT